MSDYFTDLPLHCQHVWWLIRHVRAVTRDRFGKHYWCTVDEYSSGSFQISLRGWPGLTFFSSVSGWIALGYQKDDPTTWRIFDVRVTHNRQRGLGTALVRAGIALARRQGARELRGFVTADDEELYPFLLAWYARLGFTVAPNRTFMMRLTNKW